MLRGASVATQVDVFGAVLKRHVQSLRRTVNSKVELVFLVDESSSVGAANFDNELKFVKKLLADFTVDIYTTRVAVVTFSSPSRHATRPSIRSTEALAYCSSSSVLFSRPRSEGWPHHGRTFSIYPCPLSF